MLADFLSVQPHGRAELGLVDHESRVVPLVRDRETSGRTRETCSRSLPPLVQGF